jgi:uncharacterized protein YdhG (YjbR/CyaY superfamily)
MKMNAYTTIDEYITNFPSETQAILGKIRSLAQHIFPDAEETIRYGIPTFRVNNKNKFHFAAYEHHIGLYPLPKGSSELSQQIAPYVTGKGTMQFPLNEPIPFELINKILVAHSENK